MSWLTICLIVNAAALQARALLYGQTDQTEQSINLGSDLRGRAVVDDLIQCLPPTSHTESNPLSVTDFARMTEDTGRVIGGVSGDVASCQVLVNRTVDELIETRSRTGEFASCETFRESQMPGWVGYRLGDLVGAPSAEIFSQLSEYHRPYPGTIAAKYVQRVTFDRKDYPRLDVLEDIIESSYPGASSPAEDGVLHLRLANSVEGPGCCHNYTAAEYLKRTKWVNGFHYDTGFRTDFKYQKALAELLPEVLCMQRHGVRKVTIIAGGNGNMESTSCQILAAVSRLLEVLGFTVTAKIQQNPDDDFALASRARVFIPAGGNFGEVIGKMVRRRGGTVC